MAEKPKLPPMSRPQTQPGVMVWMRYYPHQAIVIVGSFRILKSEVQQQTKCGGNIQFVLVS